MMDSNELTQAWQAWLAKQGFTDGALAQAGNALINDDAQYWGDRGFWELYDAADAIRIAA